MSPQPVCPACQSAAVAFSQKRQVYVCADCTHEFSPEDTFVQRRIFLSYGHDSHTAFAETRSRDLTSRGHDVWFDADRIKPGGDWEAYIDAGLSWAAEVRGPGRFISSVRCFPLQAGGSSRSTRR